jgi:hypothetical protein
VSILINLFGSILKKLPSDIVKKALDKGLDAIEDAVEKSENKVDDALVLPAIKFLRQQLGIEETPGSGYEDNAGNSQGENSGES